MRPMSITSRFAIFAILVTSLLLISGCQGALSPQPAETQTTEAANAAPAEVEASSPEHKEALSAEESRPELEMPSPIALDPSRGAEIGTVFEAFLSPHQEGGEEEETPGAIPAVFKSTAPSVDRNQRTSRGHGVLSFSRDLSKAYVHVAVEDVDPADIAMFHIHCGRPGQLGPILVDFSLAGNLQHYLDDGVLTLEITNEDIEAVVAHGDGLIGALTAGCPITMALPMDKVKTIAGMETIAREGELYFNLHTHGQMFFGDIRGQLHQVEK
jgi:hypothetical protein